VASSESVGLAVIGAGPAGLTAAHVLSRRGAHGIVYEADGVVGGISKTVERDGYRFDLGGHRFFTRIGPIQRLWEETLGDEFLLRPRLSRIFYRGRFFAYPLRAEDVIRRLGLIEVLRCAGSWLAVRLRPRREKPTTFEDWVTDRFGRRLYEVFFRTYTEKVWGIPGSEIESEWAVQRIKNLSFREAFVSALGLKRTHVTSLIEEFRYPRLGPGQMWEAFRERVEASGIPVLVRHRVTKVEHRKGRIEAIELETPLGTVRRSVSGVLSTMPLSELVLALDPVPPRRVVEAAERLRYRDMIVVGLITSDPDPFPDNWIYVHDPGVSVGRVQNFGAWSASMTRPGATSLGAEYFCFENDELWRKPDSELVELAASELASIGLVDPAHIVEGFPIRVRRAYPMYDRGYGEAVTCLRDYVASFTNLQTAGRNGLHRYNNQDHSMWTAMLATVNLLDGADHDVWAVGTESDYLERGLVSESALGSELVDAVS